MALTLKNKQETYTIGTECRLCIPSNHNNCSAHRYIELRFPNGAEKTDEGFFLNLSGEFLAPLAEKAQAQLCIGCKHCRCRVR
jgi:hypothetical protein